MPLIPPNHLKSHLAAGRLAVGTMIAEFRQVSVMQALKNAGFDWAIIDNEHGVFSNETIAELGRAGRWVGVTPIVRVPALSYEQITQALDGGAQGVMLPRVTGPEQVRQAVAAVKYPPLGQRGSALGRGHTEFKSGDVVAMMAEANLQSFVVVQIETKEAVERLEEIAAVPGVDALLIGPNDLSIALGVAGKMRDPILTAAIDRTIEVCRRWNIVPAIHTNDVALTAEWGKRGMRMVSISSEIGFLQKAGKDAVDQIRA